MPANEAAAVLFGAAKRLNAAKSPLASAALAEAAAALERPSAAAAAESGIATLRDKLLVERDDKAFAAAVSAVLEQRGSAAPSVAGSTVASVAAKLSASTDFADPRTQQFWAACVAGSAGAGGTADAVPYVFFVEKFLSFFGKSDDTGRIADCKEKLKMRQSVWQELAHRVVGNRSAVSRAALQHFLYVDTTLVVLPHGIVGVVDELASRVPTVGARLAEVIEKMPAPLSDPDAPMLVRDGHLRFANLVKLTTTKCEEVFRGCGVQQGDAAELALAVYMKNRESLPNTVEFLSKLDAAKKRIHEGYACIDLSSCGLEEIASLVQDFKRFPDIHHLDLSSNNIHAKGAPDIVRVLDLEPNLRSVNLSGNNIQASGIVGVLLCLSRNHDHLKVLNLSFCHGGVRGAKAVVDAAPAFSALDTFDFAGNHLEAEGAITIARALPSFSSLSVLRLDSNGLGNDGAAAIAAVLGQCPNLVHLSLSNNRIGDTGVDALLPAARQHPSLEIVDLSVNPCTAGAGQAMLATMGRASYLNVVATECIGIPANMRDAIGAAGVANQRALQKRLAAIRGEPLASWTTDTVHFWTHRGLRNLALATALKSAGVSGAKIAAYTAAELAREFPDTAARRQMLSFPCAVPVCGH